MNNKRTAFRAFLLLLSVVLSFLLTGCVSHPVFMVNTNDILRLKGIDSTKVNELSPGGGHYTALWAASKNGKIEFVRVLLDKGADPNIIGSNASSPLLEAANARHEDIIKLLLEAGADPNFKNFSGATALNFAIGNRVNVAIIKEMLDKGADVNIIAKDSNSWYTPLKIAAEQRQYDVVELLLERGADISLPREHSPLAVASQIGDQKLIELLVSKGAGINDSSSFNGNTPLHYAMSKQQWQAAELLLSKGADGTKKNHAQENALHVGAAFGIPRSLISKLIEKGISINERDATQSSALIFASRFNQTPSALSLVERDADVHVINNVGDTALHWAVLNTNYALIRSLVDKGANIYHVNSSGYSPMSLANNNSSIISILLKGPSNAHQETPSRKPEQPSKSSEPRLVGTGSGFFINKSGELLTNYHVIDKCKTLKVEGSLNTSEAEVLAFDTRNDIALLKTKRTPEFSISINSHRNIPLGEEVTVLGFPLSSILGNTLKLTTGNISSHTGIGGDTSLYQISAPIQAGNSGGPVFDENGSLAGIAVATLSLPIDKRSGSLPQNVNYAIKSTAVIEFLDANNVDFSSESNNHRMSAKEIALKNENSVLMVQCYR